MDWVQLWYAFLAGLITLSFAGATAIVLAMLYMFTLTVYIKWHDRQRAHETRIVLLAQKKKKINTKI